jgi:uncharacterized protein YyaL (SSP411 family)
MNLETNILSADELKLLPPDGGSTFNRLIFEKSPYLLQHARNPVDWHAWTDEAFELARKSDRPVFLSIGYSTCHWCHVMEKESFEDERVAELLNDGFVSIKVDREERPDIDQIYMAVCQAVTGMGGWPLTVILTPERLPFFAGTYFPKESRFGRTGMTELLPKVLDIWNTKREELIDSANQITSHLVDSSTRAAGKVYPGVSQVAFEQLESRFDRLYGGFGSAPKFPSAHNLIFLLRYWRATGEHKALEMVEKTLSQMRLGGIFDQVGFGFHRYSTDEAWLLPHFEKMLYDQALLSVAYTEAYLATGKDQYAQVTRELLNYVTRDMSSPEGGFLSAEDADSEGEEGLFYQWSKQEFFDVLGKEKATLFSDLFNLKEEGNYYDEADKTKTGRNILYLKQDLEQFGDEIDLPADQLKELWEESRQILFEIREKRIHPLKDDKILTDWNGLMIAALAKASAALGDPAYLLAAEKAVDFIWKNLRDKQGRLIKRFRAGEANHPSHLDDYAFLVWGLIELYQANFQPDYLKKAMELNEIMLNEFWDDVHGGLFLSSGEQKDLIVRSKEIYDGAMPSGNSVAANNLIRLGRISGNFDLEQKAQQITEAFAEQVNPVPQGFTHLLSALLFAEGPAFEVVISGDSKAKDTRKMLQTLQQRYFPNLVILLNPSDIPDSSIHELAPWLKDQKPLEGDATAYVCQDFTCKSPTTEIEVMLESLSA